ncbi:DUF3180 domain-containing protein [Calidifontibacter sp. DB0510]|uniref:DUF3180 domain-containing protein n=1 Tax=Metallococcus carri TaxID=1656884 RepID=A0A967B0U0_9MICO|nr:DUF3180 domain-containing protein [Metallococcus carri]NHN55363.1 DUF3180 domain-containing protein [Metallococcus carri]NOP36440.1 DUF3180 family protein [Calidifontibacter sp. DB2511S]
MKNTGVAIKHVVLGGLIAFVLSFGGLRLWTSWGHPMPDVSWFAVAVLVLMAAVMLAGGWQIRAYRRHESVRIPSPQLARRTLVAGQACAWVGAIMAGWYAGHAAVDARHLDSDHARSMLLVSGVAALAAIALSVVGLLTQHWCRIDEDGQDEDDDADALRTY